jgi:hypothetical protein
LDSRKLRDTPLTQICLTGTWRKRLLGEKPTAETGGFYGKAMAIADPRERIVFLNRGQGWDVRKLREMLPRLQGGRLHADLAEMLRSHEINITLANEAMK